MKKDETITFKVDPGLLEILQTMPNRSEFIRSAILNALDSSCPLCTGTGVLTPLQKQYWDRFLQKHELRKCSETNEVFLYCNECSEAG